MSEYKIIIAWLFRYINIALLIGIGIYIFYTKVVFALRARINAKKNKIREQEYYYQELRIRKKGLDVQLEEQDRKAQDLQNNVKKWADVMIQQQILQEKIIDKRKEVMKNKQQLQQQNIQQYHKYHYIIDKVSDTTRKNLQDKYSDHSMQQQYMEDIMIYITKNLS